MNKTQIKNPIFSPSARSQVNSATRLKFPFRLKSPTGLNSPRRLNSPRKLNSSSKLNSSGLSLIEMMVGLGLLGIMIVGTLSMMTVQNKAILGNRTVVSRDGLRLLLERYVMDGAYLSKSAKYSGSNNKGNVALDYCLNGKPPGVTTDCPTGVFPKCCKQTTADSPQPFHFLDPSDLNGNLILAGTELAASPLAATDSQPARFDVSGDRCTAASPQCPIEVVTSFIASCGGSATCEQASQILVTYSIRQAPGVKLAAGSPLKTITKTVLPTLAQAAAASAPSDAGGRVCAS